MYSSIISLRFGIRIVGSDMVGLGFWNFRVLGGGDERDLSEEAEKVGSL